MEIPPKTETPRIQVLIAVSPDHHHALLKRASETSPVYFRLKNAVKTESDIILVPCNDDEAKMLLEVAKHFCPEAVAGDRSCNPSLAASLVAEAADSQRFAIHPYPEAGACQCVAESIRRCWTVDLRVSSSKGFPRIPATSFNIVLSEMMDR